MARRNLNTWQRSHLGLALKLIYQEQGLRNMMQGGGDRKSPEYQEKSGCLPVDNPIQRVDSLGQAAQEVGVSRATLAKADFVGKHASDYPEVIDRLNDGKLSLNLAYRKLKQKVAVAGRPGRSETERPKSPQRGSGPGTNNPGRL